jgi:hypothetical protein
MLKGFTGLRDLLAQLVLEAQNHQCSGCFADTKSSFANTKSSSMAYVTLAAEHFCTEELQQVDV